MKRKLLKLTFALFATMVCSSVNATTTSGTWGDNITWTLDNGVLTLSGTGAMYDSGHYDNEFTWGTYANEITSVVIEEGITTIATMAFEMYEGLISISIPSSVTTIGEMSFEGCTNLTTVTISEGVITIGATAFDGCTSITTITIPSSVTTIVSGAFAGCNGITDVYCYADPSNLTWTMDEGFADFKDGKGTNFHVADESAWEKATDTDPYYYLNLRVTFEEDLANISATPVGEYHWATFYDADKKYEVDANTTIYKASVTEDPKVIITAIEGNNIIPAGTAVILKSTGVPVLTETTTESTGDYSENALQGSNGTIDTDANRIYCLAYMNDKLAFYKVNGGVSVPAGKAYLHLDAGARGFYDIEEGGTTAIKNIKVGKEDNIYYDLQGRRVLYPKKGLYILNGKKVIIK